MRACRAQVLAQVPAPAGVPVLGEAVAVADGGRALVGPAVGVLSSRPAGGRRECARQAMRRVANFAVTSTQLERDINREGSIDAQPGKYHLDRRPPVLKGPSAERVLLKSLIDVAAG